MSNQYNCPKAIWNKFSDYEKIEYNRIRDILEWKDLYHTKIKNDEEITDVTAHNIACQLIWVERDR